VQKLWRSTRLPIAYIFLLVTILQRTWETGWLCWFLVKGRNASCHPCPDIGSLDKALLPITGQKQHHIAQNAFNLLFFPKMKDLLQRWKWHAD
jgi:hypothetical protein